MREYIAKPIKIKAIQFTGDNMDEVKKYCSRTIYEEHKIIDDYLIKERFILLIDEDPNSYAPIYFKKDDYFLEDYCSYSAMVMEKDEFERKYKGVKPCTPKKPSPLNIQFTGGNMNKIESYLDRNITWCDKDSYHITDVGFGSFEVRFYYGEKSLGFKKSDYLILSKSFFIILLLFFLFFRMLHSYNHQKTSL